MINAEQKQTKKWELTGEGRNIADGGSYEANVFKSINASDGMLQAELMVRIKILDFTK